MTQREIWIESRISEYSVAFHDINDVKLARGNLNPKQYFPDSIEVAENRCTLIYKYGLYIAAAFIVT